MTILGVTKQKGVYRMRARCHYCRVWLSTVVDAINEKLRASGENERQEEVLT